MRYGCAPSGAVACAEAATQGDGQVLLVGAVEAALRGRQVEPAAELGDDVLHGRRGQRRQQPALGVHARGDDERNPGMERGQLSDEDERIRRGIDVEVEHHHLELAGCDLGQLARRQGVVDAEADGAERLGDAPDGCRMAGDHGAAPVLGQLRIRRQESHNVL